MKKIYLIALCLFSCVAMAQGPGRLMKTQNVGNNNIIRHDPTTGRHITYSEAPSGVSHFSVTDYLTEKDFTFAYGLDVKDFEIIDDYVFFCGKTSSNSGFLGWFSISDLYVSGLQANFDPNLIVGDMATLENIEVFRDGSGYYHVAGYGKDAGISGANVYRAFEAEGRPTSTMDYRTLRIDCEMFGDKVVDMAVTDNFVVYLGQCMNSYSTEGYGLTLHAFPKFDMFGTPPYLTQFYQTVSYTYLAGDGRVNCYDPIHSSRAKIVHSKKDEVAVCSYREDLAWTLLPSNLVNYTITGVSLVNRTFDLSPLLVGSDIAMLSAARADLRATFVGDIVGFIYDPTTEHYAVLHSYQIPGLATDYYVTTMNYAGGVPPASVESESQYIYDNRSVWQPLSLCLDPLGKYSVMGNSYGTMDYRYFWRNDIVRTPGVCTTLTPFTVTTMPVDVAKTRLNSEVPTPWMPLNFLPLVPTAVTDSPVSSICH